MEAEWEKREKNTDRERAETYLERQTDVPEFQKKKKKITPKNLYI